MANVQMMCITTPSVYQCFEYERDWTFIGIDDRIHGGRRAALHRVTWQEIVRDPINATGLGSVKAEDKRRLEEYKFTHSRSTLAAGAPVSRWMTKTESMRDYQTSCASQ